MKRKLAILLAVLMIFALFAACAKKEDPTDTSSPGGTASSTPTSKETGSASPTDTSVVSGSISIKDLYSLEELATMDLHPSDSATLRWAFHSTCSSLQYIGGVDDGALAPDLIFYETPLMWDSANSKPIAWLVTEWEWVGDLTMRLKIREGVTSIMGDPYTANDMLYTIDWQCNNPAITTFFGNIDLANCKVIDDYTIEIAVKKPNPFLEIEMTSGAWSQVVEASVDKIGGKEATKDDERSGTGPYKLIDWEPNIFINAERRDDYWGNMPYYKYINVTSVTDANTRMLGLEAGDYDLVTDASAIHVETAATNPDMNVLSGAAPAYCYGLIINSNHEPLNILEVRQAMALAIDYDTIVEISLRGFGDVSDAPLMPPSYNGLYTEVTDDAKNFIKYDLALAKEKMAAAGYPDGGFSIDCIFRANDSVNMTICELVSNMFSKIGITLNLLSLEGATYTTEIRLGNYGIAIAIGANPSPSRFLQPIDPRSGFPGVSGYCGDNWFGDFDIETLIDNCLNTVDETQRLGYWKELNDFCRENIPKFILCGRWTTAISTADVDGMSINAYGNPHIWSVYANEYITG